MDKQNLDENYAFCMFYFHYRMQVKEKREVRSRRDYKINTLSVDAHQISHPKLNAIGVKRDHETWNLTEINWISSDVRVLNCCDVGWPTASRFGIPSISIAWLYSSDPVRTTVSCCCLVCKTSHIFTHRRSSQRTSFLSRKEKSCFHLPEPWSQNTKCSPFARPPKMHVVSSARADMNICPLTEYEFRACNPSLQLARMQFNYFHFIITSLMPTLIE